MIKRVFSCLLLQYCLVSLVSINLAVAAQFDCEQLNDLKAEYQPQLPLDVDGFSTLTQLNVDCENKTVHFIKKLKISENQLAAGFRGRKQAQYQQLHCNDQGLARHGWNSIDTISDKKGQFLVELVARPDDCAFLP